MKADVIRMTLIPLAVGVVTTLVADLGLGVFLGLSTLCMMSDTFCEKYKDQFNNNNK